ncbi:MAG: Gfo/Idh/MocA family oxidoreductase, partial [Pseudomonadales bacterium]|nr:Gfo/Idh/MocA family oxidoreductase [Pseudomonadales bacterium]
MTSPIHVALIGMGSQGKEHIEAAQKHTQIKIVAGVESSAEARKALVLSYPDIQLFDHIAALKQASHSLDLQGLILALPHHVYEENWQDILAFNLPLLKEKPLGRNYKEAQDFVRQANKKGIVLQTAIQRRHHPSYQFLRDYIQQNQLDVEEIHAHLHLGKKPHTPAHNMANWRDIRHRSGGGALLDTGYHLVDLLHFLIGPFELVSATILGNNKLDDGDLIDDRAWLTARAEQCWISIDTWVYGSEKSEQVSLLTNKGLL